VTVNNVVHFTVGGVVHFHFFSKFWENSFLQPKKYYKKKNENDKYMQQ